jgi:DNA-binding MarR family transcriptional regulator
MSSHNKTQGYFRLLARLNGLEEAFFLATGRKTGLRDLSRVRGELLHQINRAGGRLQVQDIADRTGRPTSTTAELAAKLCRDGYAFKMKVAGDGRGVWVVLSGKGRRAAASYERARRDLDRMVRGLVTGADMGRLEKAALQLEKYIRKGTQQ